MYYFIPDWQIDLIPWFRPGQSLEFDTTIHQLRIFQEEKIPAKLLFVHYVPQARYFLHRQDLLEVDVYSIFDHIQQVGDLDMKPLQLKDFSWPDDCEFVYTPFIILVRRQGQVYAEVHFGSEGYLSFMDFFENGVLTKKMILDDRGFLSSWIYYQEGQATHQEYFTPNGDWVLREYFKRSTAKVEINTDLVPDVTWPSYSSMEELVFEQVTRYLVQEMPSHSRFVLAYSAFNQKISKLLPQKSSKILTIFAERHGDLDLMSLAEDIPLFQMIVTDSQEMKDKLVQAYPTANIHYLPPYDTRLRLGESQSRIETKIYYQMDRKNGIDEQALLQVLKLVAANPLVELTIGVYNADGGFLEQVYKVTENLLLDAVLKQQLTKNTDSFHELENATVENKDEFERFEIRGIYNELDLINELQFTRLIVDLSPTPHIYTQIAGISAGIPQINVTPSPYVEHLKNGYILSGLEELDTAVEYYTATLKNWNESLIDSIQKIRENTGSQFVQKWNRWLEEN